MKRTKYWQQNFFLFFLSFVGFFFHHAFWIVTYTSLFGDRWGGLARDKWWSLWCQFFINQRPKNRTQKKNKNKQRTKHGGGRKLSTGFPSLMVESVTPCLIYMLNFWAEILGKTWRVNIWNCFVYTERRDVVGEEDEEVS